MDQLGLFDEEELFWIPEIDNDCRMWKCPVCNKRMVGQPIGWYQFNYYKYCPYCGTRLFTSIKYVSDVDGLPGDLYAVSSSPVSEGDVLSFVGED